ncbi:MAG: DNA cytosine methyltransferase [Rhodospirillales bacterium]|nr:MAG: DNA cytosine methyltransferase [Rhodospirillales bacterium]
MRGKTIHEKMARLRAGAPPRVLDLFAGCGGLSLGFHAAGFDLQGAVEFDPDAARSYGLNFHHGEERHSVPRDIIATTPQELAAQLSLGSVAEAIDVVVGGPPCQAFARVGRPKLREIDAHPQAFRHDPRARLYQEYLRYVDAFQPVAILMENVPDVLNHGGQNIAEEICEVLEGKGYVCGYTLLNAAFYGVPQMRERMFLIGYHRDLTDRISFPEATNWMVLPPGYEGSRAVALKVLNGLMHAAHDYIEPPAAHPALPAAVTAEDAIGDLPAIYAREELAAGRLVRGARRFDQAMAYDRRRRKSAYATMMRSWPGFEAPEEGLRDHVIRYLPRDYELFARLNPGDQYPQAWQHAMNMLSERLAILRRQGTPVIEGSAEYRRLHEAIVPPYDAGKFPNKWRKMWRDQPARTLMAHLGKDSYSHIHYDSAQARTISVREAARLQSFPDGFVFCGTMNPAFRQIGNAVPPLMARALASTIMEVLRGRADQTDYVSRRTAAAV